MIDKSIFSPAEEYTFTSSVLSLQTLNSNEIKCLQSIKTFKKCTLITELA